MRPSIVIPLVALAALFFGLWAVPVSIGNDAGAGEFRRFAIAIKNRKVDVAQKLIRVTRGDTLELEFSTDETAELHLHGYDKLIKVDPATPAVLHLDASIAGRFSIEAHGFGSARSGYHVLLLYLEVHP